jgi:hypothetical protein
MIVFELICPDHHRFEGWFASSTDFESQKAGGLLACPVCSHCGIEKLPTAKIAKGEAQPGVANTKPAPAEDKPKPGIQEIIDLILVNTDNVGKAFPAEARRIHSREVPHRNIRGMATLEETRELLDEGIEVLPLPLPPRSDWH